MCVAPAGLGFYPVRPARLPYFTSVIFGLTQVVTRKQNSINRSASVIAACGARSARCHHRRRIPSLRWSLRTELSGIKVIFIELRDGGRPLLAEAAPLRERIPDVATELFSAEGYRTTSIKAVPHVTAVLDREARAGYFTLGHPQSAAEQFFDIVIAIPRRHAVGLGNPMTEAERNARADSCVNLFVNCCRL